MTRSGRSATPSPGRGDTPAAPGGSWPLGAVFTLLLVAVFIAYFPSLRGTFLWDDAGHVTSPALRSWSGLLRIWFEPGATQQYYPLLHSAFWLEHQLWGDAPLGYRLTNLVWHTTAACLFIGLLRRLAIPGAFLAGLLFALHPVCVESVAWIAEQKNTLSLMLYLAAAHAWLRFENDRRPATYAIATAWFLAALLTKTVTATLPAALLVLAWWRRGRVSRSHDVLPLLPWLAAGIIAGLFTVWFERTGIGAQGADFDLSLIERGLLAGRVVWFYFGQLLWPANLMFFYPRWDIDGAALWQWAFLIAALVLVGGLLRAVQRGHARGVFAALVLFVGGLFPVLGFLNVYPFVFSYVADHFQYLPSLSLFALAGAGAANAARSEWFKLGRFAPALVAVVAVALGALTWQQSKSYVNSIALYRATLARNPDSWIAHHNLASELTARGSASEALPHARRALALKPNAPEVLNNLADSLTRTGQAAEALPLVERALQLQPKYAQAENTFGITLLRLGRTDEGIRRLERAIGLQPNLPEAHYNLGLAEAERGNFTAAIRHFAEVVRLRPEHVGAHLNGGVALALNGRLTEARPYFQRALDLDPESAPVRQTYGRVLLTAGQPEDAERQLRAALRLNPNLPGLHGDLAAALQQRGQTDEARQHALETNRPR